MRIRQGLYREQCLLQGLPIRPFTVLPYAAKTDGNMLELNTEGVSSLGPIYTSIDPYFTQRVLLRECNQYCRQEDGRELLLDGVRRRFLQEVWSHLLVRMGPMGETRANHAKCSMNLYQISNPQVINGTTAHLDCTNANLKSTAACDKTKGSHDRAAALVALMTLDEKAANIVNSSPGVLRLGLMPYEWWNEALHGVARKHGVVFSDDAGTPFSSATSFPMPINLGAAFDDALVRSIAETIGKEARAFANNGRAGLDYWTPNINPFRDPRWGRGQEVPSEDAYHIQSYVANLIPGLQGPNLEQKQLIATCKHYAVYDVETDRHSRNYNPTKQDLNDYYLSPFKTCLRDAHAGSVMCSYNAVYGVPACANQYLLKDILRGHYNFTAPYQYVVSDCAAIRDIYLNGHNFTKDAASASAVAMFAGTDLDCGSVYPAISTSVSDGTTKEALLNQALTRLYTALFTVGYFDGNSPYASYGWSDVNTKASQELAYRAAVEGMTLLKNIDSTLPLKSTSLKIALIGPNANATTSMQGNYYGTPPFFMSPLSAFKAAFSSVTYVAGTAINTDSTSDFTAATDAAKAADIVIYVGGLDQTIEAEGRDRTTITWPGNQLSLISSLASTGKPLVIVQFGGGQVDDSTLLSNAGVKSLLWAGYPGQDGGRAIVDVISGKAAPAGRLPITQYPANYVNQLTIFDPNLQPSGSKPGRTYKWYNAQPILPFGYGLHYTNFTFNWTATPAASYDIAALISAAGKQGGYTELASFATVKAEVTNAGSKTSDYAGLLFLSSTNAGPTPRPIKSLVSYARARDIVAAGKQVLEFPLTLASLARADSNGDLVIYPGDYTLVLDISSGLSTKFILTGTQTVVEALPREGTYTYPVPVVPQL